MSPQGRRCQQEDGGRGKREGLQGLHSSSRGPSGGSSERGGRPREAPADLINDSEAADSSLSPFTPETKKRPDFHQPNVSFYNNNNNNKGNVLPDSRRRWWSSPTFVNLRCFSSVKKINDSPLTDDEHLNKL